MRKLHTERQPIVEDTFTAGTHRNIGAGSLRAKTSEVCMLLGAVSGSWVACGEHTQVGKDLGGLIKGYGSDHTKKCLIRAAEPEPRKECQKPLTVYVNAQEKDFTGALLYTPGDPKGFLTQYLVTMGERVFRTSK